MKQNIPLEKIITHFRKDAVGLPGRVIKGYILAIEDSFKFKEITQSERDSLILELDNLKNNISCTSLRQIVNYLTLKEKIEKYRNGHLEKNGVKFDFNTPPRVDFSDPYLSFDPFYQQAIIKQSLRNLAEDERRYIDEEIEPYLE